MKFVEFLARRVIALQEKLGPGATSIPLESEPNDQSIPSRRERSRLPSPIRKTPPPSRRSSPVTSKTGLSHPNRFIQEGVDTCRWGECVQSTFSEHLQPVEGHESV